MKLHGSSKARVGLPVIQYSADFGLIEVRDAATQQILHNLQHPNDAHGVISMAFSPDGELFGSRGVTLDAVAVWDLKTGKLARSIEGSS